MEQCDQRGCTARATREILFDNRHVLYGCSHDTAEWLPWLPADVRFDPEPTLIVT